MIVVVILILWGAMIGILLMSANERLERIAKVLEKESAQEVVTPPQPTQEA